MRLAAKDLLSKAEQHLSGLSDQLIAELNNIMQGDWGVMKTKTNSQVQRLDLEVFTDGYRIVLYPMDSSYTQIGVKSLFEDRPDGVLSDEHLNPDLEEYDFNNEDDNRALNEFDTAQRKIFLAWFVACWSKTKHTKLSIPIYLVFHDTLETLDLRSNKWVSQ